ncbi:DUF2341 domain-containing protein [Chloroflexota bacterium]
MKQKFIHVSVMARFIVALSIICIVSSLFPILAIPVEASPGWYDTSWNKRAPVVIDNSGGGALTNYQAVILVTYDSDMQTDFDDLRFTDSDEVTELNYWIEWKIDSVQAQVWVKVPYISASSIKTIYMYYGNPTAVSASNGINTFIIFDDFEDGDVSDWYTVAGTPAISPSMEQAYQGSYSIKLTTTGEDYWVRKDIPQTITENYIIEFAVYQTGNNLALYSYGTGYFIGYFFAPSNAGCSLTIIDPDPGIECVGDTFTEDTWQWYYTVVNLAPIPNTFSFSLQGGGLYGPYNTSGDGQDFAFFQLGTKNYGGGGGYFDLFRVRKYASPEPTISVGEEESKPLPAPTPLPSSQPSPPGEPVGGEVYPVNKVSLITPWIALAAIILAGGVYLIRRRVHS